MLARTEGNKEEACKRGVAWQVTNEVRIREDQVAVTCEDLISFFLMRLRQRQRRLMSATAATLAQSVTLMILEGTASHTNSQSE